MSFSSIPITRTTTLFPYTTLFRSLSPATLAVNASCAINVTFTPTGLFTRAATLAISDNAIGNPQQVTLAGTGLDPLPSLSATSVTFPNQQVGTPSTPQAVTLSNTGNAPLTISSITTTGTNSDDFAPTG